MRIISGEQIRSCARSWMQDAVRYILEFMNLTVMNYVLLEDQMAVSIEELGEKLKQYNQTSCFPGRWSAGIQEKTRDRDYARV